MTFYKRTGAAVLNYVGGYALDMYCDHVSDKHGFEEFPHQFTGETFSECAAWARKAGWVFHRDTRTATCRKCVR